MNVAVTGAAGYIGSRVVHELLAEHPGWSVSALDNFYLGEVERIGDVTVEDVDVRDRDALEGALSGADVVMHLAAISGVDDCTEQPDLSYEVNVQGTENVAWFCRKTGTGLVFPFSMAVLGDPERFPVTVDLPRRPMNWYGRTKYLNEQAISSLAEGAFPAHLLLKSNMYGYHMVGGRAVTGNNVFNNFIERGRSGEPLPVYEPGTQARNYVHVNDVATAYVRSAERLAEQLESGTTGATAYEIGSDEDPSVLTLAELVSSLARDVLGVDAPVSLVENPRANETLVPKFGVDTSRTRAELGWKPVHSIEETVRELLASVG